MSKKWKIALGVLVVVVIFCFWYTRPRSLEQIAGEGQITSISQLAQAPGLRDDGKAVINTWQVDSHEGREQVNSGLEEILKGCRYRVSLRSLLPFPSQGSIPGETGAPIIHLAAAVDHEPGFTAICRGPAVLFSVGGKTVLAQAEDKEFAEKLLAYTQEFGWET